MHGCPPDEIEAICRYMLTEKNLNTFVKLNPTLLGYPRVRQILDACGFGYIGLSEASFDHDLKIDRALEMLTRLMALAKEQQPRLWRQADQHPRTVNKQRRAAGR